MDKRRLLMLGVASGVVILGGIILAVLLYQTVVTVGDGYITNSTDPNLGKSIEMISGRVWLFSLVGVAPMGPIHLSRTTSLRIINPQGKAEAEHRHSLPSKEVSIDAEPAHDALYIIPGIIGLIGAFLQNKCMYVVTCIFTMLSLLVMGLVALVAGMGLIAFIFSIGSISEFCKDVDDMCKCRTSGDSYYGEYKDTSFKTCAHIEKLNALIMALLFFIIIPWVAELVEFIFSCCFSCRSKTTTGGMILSTQQPMLLSNDNQDYPPTKV